MTILDFKKPKTVKVDAGFDGAYSDGGYAPQMSQKDAQKWRAKRFNEGKDGDRIEIRKSFGHWGTQVFIIVAKDGWNLAAKHEDRAGARGKYVPNMDTRGMNFRMSMNGALRLSWAQYEEMNAAIREAWSLLNVDTEEKTA